MAPHTSSTSDKGKSSKASTDQTTLADGAGAALADKADGASTNGKKPLQPVTLRSAHDYALVTEALTHRKDELEKLGEKVTKEGYPQEGRRINDDVRSIQFAIMPQFSPQRELPLVTQEKLSHEIDAALKVFIYRAFDQLDNPKNLPTAVGIRGRRDRLVEVITERVSLYAVDLAAHAFSQGYAFREANPESLALHPIKTLRGRDD